MKWFTIFVLILIWLVCSARSCSEGGNPKERYERKILSVAIDSVKQAFDVNTPGDQLLSAYEAAAIQKLMDFADYMKIATDNTVDKSFRMQASHMARNLFISTETDTRAWYKAFAGDKKSKPGLLPDEVFPAESFWRRPVEINVSSPLKQENDSTFKGSLTFYQQNIPFTRPDQSIDIPVKLSIDMYATRKLKSFGDEQLKVWDVYLGDIR